MKILLTIAAYVFLFCQSGFSQAPMNQAEARTEMDGYFSKYSLYDLVKEKTNEINNISIYLSIEDKASYMKKYSVNPLWGLINGLPLPNGIGSLIMGDPYWWTYPLVFWATFGAGIWCINNIYNQPASAAIDPEGFTYLLNPYAIVNWVGVGLCSIAMMASWAGTIISPWVYAIDINNKLKKLLRYDDSIQLSLLPVNGVRISPNQFNLCLVSIEY